MNILLHDKQHFFKYCTSNTLKQILKNRTLKWSSPTIFNDPFDIQTDLRFGFEMEDLKEPLLREQVEIIWGDKEPEGNALHPFFSSMLEARSNRKKYPDCGTKEQFIEHMRKVNDKSLKEYTEATISWWKSLSKNLRIYCVSEIHDDILMWSHYSENHSGAVIKHKVIPGKDYAICAATQVQYREDLPVIASLETYIKHVTGQKEIDYNSVYKNFTNTKSIHWSYEREWRCVAASTKRDQDFEFFNIFPEEIDAIYFGCRMSENDQIEIKNLLISDLCHVKIFKAVTHRYKYELEFIPVDFR